MNGKVEEQLIVTNGEGFNIDLVHFDFGPRPTINKPWTALWTSTFLGLDEDKHMRSEWTDFLDGWEHKSDEYRTILVPKKDLKIFELNYRTIDKIPYDPILRNQIDWREIARNYDGFHLPCAFPGSKFEFWDCESYCWFNTDWIDQIKPSVKYN